MKNKLLLSLVFLSFALRLTAQDFEIVSVESLPNDFAAREEIKTDHNDHQCALIRIATQSITPEQRELFTFKTDYGSEVVERATRNGEIWLWVSPGLKYLRIMHREWGQYELHLLDHISRVEAMHTYKIIVKGTAPMPPSENNGNQTLAQQYLVFQITPANAMLEVNEDLWEVGANGVAKNFVNFGTYSYRVQAPNYHPETNTVTVDDPDNAETVIVNLKPDFVEVTLQVDADAEIWINNEKKGTRTWKGPLGKGTYKIECKQAYHETTVVSKEITADMNGQTITLAAPKPIYGSLNIESTPDFATIYIDGKEMGKTPKSIPQILIGQHELKLTMDGYADYMETIIIAKGERKQVTATLSKGKPEEIFTVNGVSFTMKFVEGGTFQMGATSEQGSVAESNEKPVHSVTLSSFYMGETEVTQALWKAVMGDNPSYFLGDDLPVEQVRWDDCQKFISKLNQMTGKNFRLPSEAEWEYAARGGKKSRGYKYAGSNTIGNVAWYDGNSGSKTHIVKTKSPNELGLYDMSGNVYEWCNDWYANYNDDSPVNPEKSYVILRRGGSFGDDGGCRVSSRDFFIPVDVYYDYITGFRLCLPQLTANPVNNGGQSSIQQTSSTIPEGAVSGVFSISTTQKVYFSKGNLQYQASTNTWRFAEHQWDMIGDANKNISPSYSGWIDLFGWGTGDDPTKTSNSDYSIFTDWGSAYGDGWRTLTENEWEYVFNKRSTASGIRYAKATVNSVNGVILFPDDWDESTYKLGDHNNPRTNYSSNNIDASTWNNIFAPKCAVFLPAAGWRWEINNMNSISEIGSRGYYWAASFRDKSDGSMVNFAGSYFSDAYTFRSTGLSVRLVCPVKN